MWPGCDPEGFPVGGAGFLLIAPGREQVAEDVMLPGVTGPAFDRLPGRGDGLVERLQPLFTPLSTSRIVPRHPMFRGLPQAAL